MFYGECSELCGARHAFMPIEVQVVSEADFAAWLAAPRRIRRRRPCAGGGDRAAECDCGRPRAGAVGAQ